MNPQYCKISGRAWDGKTNFLKCKTISISQTWEWWREDKNLEYLAGEQWRDESIGAKRDITKIYGIARDGRGWPRRVGLWQRVAEERGCVMIGDRNSERVVMKVRPEEAKERNNWFFFFFAGWENWLEGRRK